LQGENLDDEEGSVNAINNTMALNQVYNVAIDKVDQGLSAENGAHIL